MFFSEAGDAVRLVVDCGCLVVLTVPCLAHRDRLICRVLDEESGLHQEKRSSMTEKPSEAMRNHERTKFATHRSFSIDSAIRKRETAM